MCPKIPFDDLAHADLHVDAVYPGGTSGTANDDPLSRLLPCGNQGGFRYAGSHKGHTLRMVLLYTSGADPDWPDVFDQETGRLTYFGDNRAPGKGLHDTPRGGNDILRWGFAQLHGSPPMRSSIPPFFVFSKDSPGVGRDVRFLGLAVPGAQDVGPSEDLVAIWRSAQGQRFQNYKSTFTVLDVNPVPRAWILELAAGKVLGGACPEPFSKWVKGGAYTPLRAPRNIHYRTTQQQQPGSPTDAALVAAIYEHFKDDPYSFEACAIEIWRMQAKQAVTFEATRRSVDGGRDAVGHYYLGPESDRIKLEWSLEAKLYAPTNGIGVKETARLISRLRHREFGVLVTTSFVGKQAYEELRRDEQPVVIICGADIASLLKQNGLGDPAAVKAWLEAKFPMAGTSLQPEV